VKVAGKYTLDKELAGRQDFRAAHPAHPAAQKALEQGPVNVAGPLEQTESRKRAACYAHASQNPVNGFYGTYHEKMNRFRGLECACELAEGFVATARVLRRPCPDYDQRVGSLLSTQYIAYSQRGEWRPVPIHREAMRFSAYLRFP
jgi:hypothetical protein